MDVLTDGLTFFSFLTTEGRLVFSQSGATTDRSITIKSVMDIQVCVDSSLHFPGYKSGGVNADACATWLQPCQTLCNPMDL